MNARTWRNWIGRLAAGCLLTGIIVGQEPPAAPAQPAAPIAPTVPAPPHQAHNNVRRAIEWKRSDYTCEGETKLTVYLAGSLAKVRFQDHVYLMKQTPSADGNRYSDGKVLWWGKGSGGFLQEDTPDGDGRLIVKDCKLDKPPNADGAGIVAGTISCRQRMMLPADAEIEVKLLDISPTTPRIIATQRTKVEDHQLPAPFELRFDPVEIDAQHRYEVRARILNGNFVIFDTVQQYLVLTGGKPCRVEMILDTPRP